MRAFAYLALPLAFAVCSADPATAKAAAKAVVTANGSKPGTYDVKHADGTVTRTILNADGTYRDLAANGKVEAKGTWSVTGGKTCFAPSTKGAHRMCFKEARPAKDGSFTATPDKGKPVTVTPAAD
jgi:ABC-type oligopeptide transport system substrate-binding subunit